MLCLSDFVWFLIRRSKMKLFIDKLKNHIYWLKISSGLYDGMDDETFLKMAYKRKFGKELDLNNPVTFNEKLQWLKLNDRKPEYTEMVCKKYLSRVLSLYVIWNIIYLPITIFGFKENNMSFARYVLDCIRGFLFIGQQFYSWQLWYLLSVFFVIASICIMAEHKIKDKNIFKIMMAIFLMGGGYRSTNDS